MTQSGCRVFATRRRGLDTLTHTSRRTAYPRTHVPRLAKEWMGARHLLRALDSIRGMCRYVCIAMVFVRVHPSH